MHSRTKHEVLHIVITFLIGEGPAILMISDLVECWLFLYEEEEELTIWPIF